MFRTWNWNALNEIDAIRREIDRVFEGAGTGTGWPVPFSRISFLPGRSARAYPLMNLREDEKAITLECLAPGIDPKSLNVSILKDQITISGEKPIANDAVKPEAYHRNERAAGRFVRAMTLPAEVDSDQVRADYKRGILTVTLPKAPSAQPRQLTINVQ